MKDQGAQGLEDAWTRFLAGEALERDQRAALTAAVASDDVFHRRLLHDLRLDGALRAAARGESDGESFVAAMRERVGRRAVTPAPALPAATPPRTGAKRRTRTPAALAALAAAAGLLLLLWRDPPGAGRRESELAAGTDPLARVLHVEAARGQARIYDRQGNPRAATRGEAIALGETLVTVGESARLAMAGADGGAIELQADTAVTRLAPRGRAERLLVARGRLKVSLPPNGPQPALEVATPHALASADGCFRLAVSPRETRIEVQRLRVRLAPIGQGRPLDVRAGQRAIARDGERLAAAPITARKALLLAHARPRAGSASWSPADRRLAARLAARGFVVEELRPGASLRQEAATASVVVITPGASGANLGWSLADLGVPIVAIGSGAAGELGLARTSRARAAARSARPTIVIQDPSHPLAAGLSGRVPVAPASAGVTALAPPAGATIVGRLADDSTAAAVFGYERGDEMVGLSAPARRVALLFDHAAGDRWSAEAWRLLDAAVTWCAAEPP